MRYDVSLTVLAAVLLLVVASTAWAEVPNLMYYQGHLTDDAGEPLDVVIPFTFAIYDDSTGGSVWWTETHASVTVENGLFYVLLGLVNPIPDTAFLDPDRWLGVTVDSDPEISPRTRLASVPWAFRVATVDGASGGIIQSDMDVLGNVDASGFSIAGVPLGTSSDSYWSQGGSNIFYNLGNVGIGTTTPSEALDVDGHIHASGDLISGNSITIDGTANQITSTSGTIDFDDENILTSGKATIGPGNSNTGSYAFVAGQDNEVSGLLATVSGGHHNTASADWATVGGGAANTASGNASTIGGGSDNTASAFLATVSGGGQNDATDTSATVSGGKFNTAGKRATVGGGEFNEALGEYAAVSGGYENIAIGRLSTIGGGKFDTTYAFSATIGGGYHNVADSMHATISGGHDNRANGYVTAIGGGGHNNASGHWSTISGGYADTASGQGATIGGGEMNAASGDWSTVGGGWVNVASGTFGTVAGGNSNVVAGDLSAILGGWGDTITASADYSYLFGIGSRLDEDSTFMVDMPHIVFEGDIIQTRPEGDTTAALSYFDGGGGFIGTFGPNSSLNAALTLVSGNRDHGGLGVANADGDWRAKMYSDPYYTGDVGIVETFGPNGNTNVMLWNALADQNGGCVSIADAAGEYRGHFLVTDDSAGVLKVLGPNGSNNFWATYLMDDHDNGYVAVCDTDGFAQAGMFVSTSGEGVVWGDLVGVKADNPKQPGTDIWYCALEGPEAAAYVRGTGHLVKGHADVTLPDHFTSVASSQGITVQVTPLSGESRGLAVVEKSKDRFAVRELNNGSGTYDFDFMVTAVRKGHEDYEVIRARINTQPADRGATRDDSPVQLMKRPGS